MSSNKNVSALENIQKKTRVVSLDRDVDVPEICRFEQLKSARRIAGDSGMNVRFFDTTNEPFAKPWVGSSNPMENGGLLSGIHAELQASDQGSIDFSSDTYLISKKLTRWARKHYLKIYRGETKITQIPLTRILPPFPLVMQAATFGSPATGVLPITIEFPPYANMDGGQEKVFWLPQEVVLEESQSPLKIQVEKADESYSGDAALAGYILELTGYFMPFRES